MTSRTLRSQLLAALFALLMSCGGGQSGTGAAGSGAPRNEATVLLSSGFSGSWPAGLDPATNTTAGANLSLMNAIFGGLFQLTADPDGSNAKITGMLATGYEMSADGRSVTIRIRPSVVFSDSTPFDAEAVAFNVRRDLDTACCLNANWPWDKQEPVRVLDDLSVMLRFTEPYPVVMNAFPTTTFNWIGSPTAMRKIGDDRFKITPVGAGPFKVVTNELSFKLELERNPLYWQEGLPYLDRLVFRSIGSEQAAFQALLAGDAQAIEGVESPRIIEQAQRDKGVVVAIQPPTSPYMVQLNTRVAPFDDQRAREALYYATDVDAIRQGLFDNLYPAAQSFTAAGGLFHHAEVPGYRTYDLERARSIVNELGGMSVKLATLKSFVAEQVITALQSQWRKAGIDTTIELYEFGTLLEAFQKGQWQAMLQTAGSYDPEAGVSVSFRFDSKTEFSGVQDARLDEMLAKAAAAVDVNVRDGLYVEIAKYISDKAYGPFLLAFAPAQLTVGGLSGPGLTTKIPPIGVNTGVLWQDVRIASK
jgi:peptide/nickel transport system substrate-binding protein